MNPIAIAAALPFFAAAALAFVVVRAPIIGVVFILLPGIMGLASLAQGTTSTPSKTPSA